MSRINIRFYNLLSFGFVAVAFLCYSMDVYALDSAVDVINYIEPNEINDRDVGIQPYCFRFTWLGPKYGPDSNFKNATCEDIIKTAKVPCNRPLIVTNNSNIPNTTWMWETYKSNVSNIACRLSHGDVCVKYSYIYNGAVENITYMCTKVNMVNSGAVTSNCYSEYQNGREIQVCVCRSNSDQIPCNSATKINILFGIRMNWLIYVLVFIFIHGWSTRRRFL